VVRCAFGHRTWSTNNRGKSRHDRRVRTAAITRSRYENIAHAAGDGQSGARRHARTWPELAAGCAFSIPKTVYTRQTRVNRQRARNLLATRNRATDSSVLDRSRNNDWSKGKNARARKYRFTYPSRVIVHEPRKRRPGRLSRLTRRLLSPVDDAKSRAEHETRKRPPSIAVALRRPGAVSRHSGHTNRPVRKPCRRILAHAAFGKSRPE